MDAASERAASELNARLSQEDLPGMPVRDMTWRSLGRRCCGFGVPEREGSLVFFRRRFDIAEGRDEVTEDFGRDHDGVAISADIFSDLHDHAA